MWPRRPWNRRPNPHSKKTLERFAVEQLEDRTVPAVYHWVGTGNLDWNDSNNWRDSLNLPGLPGPADDADMSLQAGETVTISTPVAVNSLDHNGGTLSISNSLTVSNLLDDSSISQMILTGTGSISTNGGTTVFDGNSNISGSLNAGIGAVVTFTNGTHTLNSTVNFGGAGTFRHQGGYWNVATSVTAPPDMELAGGYIIGAGNFIIPNGATFSWLSGYFQEAGTTTVAAGGTLAIAGSSNSRSIDVRTIDNFGTIQWSGTGNIYAYNGATIVNEATANFTITGDATAIDFVIQNLGSITKTSATATGTSAFGNGGTFNNNGTVQVVSGELHVGDDGSSTGTFDVAPGATLRFIYLYNINAGTQFTGAGTVRFDQVSNGSVYFNTDVSITNAELQDGYIQGDGTLTITNSMEWSGGYMYGAGVTQIASGAALDITAASAIYIGDTRTLRNAGTVNWSGLGILYGDNVGRIENQAGASFNITGDSSIRNMATFTNSGTITKTSAVANGSTIIGYNTTFNNSGTVHAQSGTIGIGDYGSSTGVYQSDAGATVHFVREHYLENGSQLNGPGLFLISTVSSSRIYINTNISVENLELNAGYLDGSGTVTVTSHLTWSGGYMYGSGVTQIAAGATLDLTSSSNVYVGDTRILKNSGQFNWTGSGDFYGESSGTFANEVNGVMDITSDANTNYLTFSNAGTINKSSTLPDGLTGFVYSTIFNNSGVVHVNSGILFVGDNGTTSGAAVFDVASGATLQFNRDYSLNEGTQLTGPGLYVFGSCCTGTFLINGNLSVANAELRSGYLGGPGTLTVTSSFLWSGGYMNGTGQTIVAAGASLDIRGSSAKYIYDRTFVNNSALGTWEDVGDLQLDTGSEFQNNGTLTINTDADITYSGGLFSNTGTIVKSSPTGVGDTYVYPSVTNTGSITIASGNIIFYGTTAQTAGSFSMSANTRAEFYSYPLVVYGGVLTGSGTVKGDVVVAGTVNPGGVGAAGTLTIDGDFTMDPAGTLGLDVLGPGLGEFDFLRILGDATLAGKLQYGPGPAYTPALGDKLSQVSFATVTGSMTTVLGNGLPGGLALLPKLTVTEQISEVALAEPFDLPDGTDLGTRLTEVDGDFSVNAGQLIAPPTVPALAALNVAPVDNVDLTMDFDMANRDGNRNVALVARADIPTGLGKSAIPKAGLRNMYLGQVVRRQGTVFGQIIAQVDGVQKILSSIVLSDLAGKVRFQVVGPSLTLYVNGVPVGSVVDRLLSSGTPGVRGKNAAADNIELFKEGTPAPQDAEFPFADTFDGFEDTTQLGAFWTERNGDFVVQGSHVAVNPAGPAANGPSVMTLNGVTAQNVRMSFDFDLTLPDSRNLNLVARYDSNARVDYRARVVNRDGEGFVELVRNRGGVKTVLRSESLGPKLIGSLRLDITGGDVPTFSVLVDGYEIINHVDDAADRIGAAGQVGVRGRGGAFDNFSVETL